MLVKCVFLTVYIFIKVDISIKIKLYEHTVVFTEQLPRVAGYLLLPSILSICSASLNASRCLFKKYFSH